jgi:hypothetical protein
MSKLFRLYFKLAEENGLSYPSGRAFYMLGRHWNGGLGRYGLGNVSYYGRKLPRSINQRRIAALKSIQDDTAKRWEYHFYNDGSPKGLKYSIGDWNYQRSTSRLDTKQNRPISSLIGSK